MNCPACRSEAPAGAKYCPACAAPLVPDAPAPPPSAPAPPPSAPAYHRADAIVPAPPMAVRPPPPPPPPSPPQPEAVPPATCARPSATGQIVFAAINMVCCGGSIFGIAALILAILSTTDRVYEDAKGKLKAARILNIVGICISVGVAFLYLLYMLFLLLFMFLPFAFGATDVIAGPTTFVGF